MKEKIYWGKRFNKGGVRQWYMQKRPFPKDSRQCEALYKDIEDKYWVSEQLLDTTNQKLMKASYVEILKGRLRDDVKYKQHACPFCLKTWWPRKAKPKTT